MIVRGRFRNLTLFDIGEAIQLEQLDALVGPKLAPRFPGFLHLSPDYVRFHTAPRVENAGPIDLSTGERVDATVKYYAYGVACVEVSLDFAMDWKTLCTQSYRWMNAPEVEKAAEELLRSRLQKIKTAVVRPAMQWLDEDYFIVEIREALNEKGEPSTATELVEEYGDEIAKIVRGESTSLSKPEREEVLRSALSYYPNDLVVVGWAGALVYDQPEAALSILDLLEYANTQLLEFRYYDELLTKLLSSVYSSLEGHDSFLSRWRLPRRAGRLNRIRLDVMELAERTEYAVKFISDMYYARVYRLSSARIGVEDYKALVNEKLKTAGELYEFMMAQFNELRMFTLEVVVTVLVLLDVILLLKGK